MTNRFHTLRADGIAVTLDLAAGHIRSLEIEAHDRVLSPLHTAPWADDPAVQEDPSIPAVLKHLSGDFFCAPFGRSDVEDGPDHGWPANSRWQLEGETGGAEARTARFRLEHEVQGASLIKDLTVRNGHPFLYIRHRFEGGRGAISVASHAMTRFEGPGRLAFSAKAFAELPDVVQEPEPDFGRSVFARSRRFDDLSKLPLADGGEADLHGYPIAERHEDFVMFAEAEGSTLGWTAAARHEQRDIVLSLKNPADFPLTFLWFSNEGRDYAPWNSRHKGVLGIEEGRAYSIYGHAASIRPNPLSEAGIPTSLTLNPNGSVSVRHILGGVPLPSGWQQVRTIDASRGRLHIENPDGALIDIPFDEAFLASPDRSSAS